MFTLMFAAAAADKPASNDDYAKLLLQLADVGQLPLLHPGETCRMVSSYDRTGGNEDGFTGRYSILRKENGSAVLAEMKGPGCIQRMWFTHSERNVPGLLGRTNEHICIYLDGDEKPALDVPLEDVFHGKLPDFPRPVADVALGGFYCYMPIPYRKSCKVVVDGTHVRFLQIVYRTFPSNKGIPTFRYPLNEPQRQALAKVVKAWSSCGDLAALDVTASETAKGFSLKAGESFDLALPQGPRTIRALRLKLKPELADAANAARLQITWDGGQTPAVDLPLDYFFCQADKPIAFRTLIVGTDDHGWYNYLPMPYRQSGKITIKAGKALEGTLSFVAESLVDNTGNIGYLHTAYNESLPTKTGVYHPWLVRKGHGRFVGVYLVTDGHYKLDLPTWLEGDEQFTCDDELRIHGTGTEDCFNGGWYEVPGRLGPGCTPLSGFPVYRKEEGKDKGPARYVVGMFRWYLTDPVSYEKSMEALLEHGPTNDVNADYRSSAFYYDTAP